MSRECLETADRFPSVLPRCIQQAVEARRHERKQEEQRRQKEAERKKLLLKSYL